jgi:hypothetical protein
MDVDFRTAPKDRLALYIASRLRDDGLDWFDLEAQITRIMRRGITVTKTRIINRPGTQTKDQ